MLSAVAADIDGDGDLDAVSASYYGQRVEWFKNTSPDFGDAPNSYGTLLDDDGARHDTVGPTLGSMRDFDPDGQPSADANGDGADEDGVMFGTIQLGNTMAGINVDLQNAATAKIDAWIDFDGNGRWETDEKILSDATAMNVAGFQTLNFSIPADAVAGSTYARVRISSAGDLGVIGAADDGEVEDYQVTILARPAVDQLIVNDGLPSRSQVTSLTVRFNSVVDHDALASAFQITNLDSGSDVGEINVVADDTGGMTSAVLSFAGDSTVSRPGGGALGNSLVDGNYQLVIEAAKIQSAFGIATMEHPHVFGQLGGGDSFFRFFGDSDGDHDVDGQDYGRFGLTFLRSVGDSDYDAQFDYDGDGDVDGQDYGRFGSNFLKSL